MEVYLANIMHDLSMVLIHNNRKSINTMIAKQFPLKSDEFPRGSPQFNDYIAVIDKVAADIFYYTNLKLVCMVVFLH